MKRLILFLMLISMLAISCKKEPLPKPRFEGGNGQLPPKNLGSFD